VEDYLLKPLKQEELTGILLRLKDKLGEEAVLELQLKRSGERRQELLLEALKSAAERGEPFLSARQAAGEYGFRFEGGVYFAALVRVDVAGARQYRDGVEILLRHALEIVRREVGALADECAAAVGKEGVAVLAGLRSYRAVEGKQCFTKIRKEIEKYYWDFLVTADLVELRNIATVAELIIDCSLLRHESRGLHYNADYPYRDPELECVDTVIQRKL